jgi:TonB family protein
VRATRLTAAALAVLLAAGGAAAQPRATATPPVPAPPVAPPAAASQPTVEPTLMQAPSLRRLEPARLPPGTRFPAPEVSVLLRLEVDEQGRVAQAAVQRGVGEPFDSAALTSIRASRFVPGRLSTGAAVPVTVIFRMRITAPPPAPVTIVGRLLERGTRRPLGGVPVQARREADVLARAQTDDTGRFTLAVPDARFRLVAVPAGHQRLDLPIDGRPGERREATFYLEAEASEFETVVRAAAVRVEVTRRVIDRDEIETVAGTQGDALKAIQNLPGVARPSFGGGPPVLRGAAPGDSRIMLEGQEIPILYHFGGLRSSVATVFIDGIDFVPGNFGVDYGRATGGIINVRLRDPTAEGFHGLVDINLYDAGVAAEGHLGRGWSVGGAFRRSYVDAILPAVLPSDAPVSFNSLPRYYDYQLMATWKSASRQRLRLLWYGSLDTVKLLLAKPSSDPVIRGNIDARVMFHSLQANYELKLRPDLRQESSLVLGLQQIDTQIGPDLFFNLNVQHIAFRTAWTWQALRWLDARAGLDIVGSNAGIGARVPRSSGGSEVSVPLSTRDTIAVDKTAVLYEPAAFLDATLKLPRRVEVVPGVRFDWYGVIRRFTVDPRLVARWEAHPGTIVKAGVGLYQKPPLPQQADVDTGNNHLLAERSLQASAGVEQTLCRGVKVDVTGFYKSLDRLVVPNPALGFDATAPRYTNDGTGRIYGLEVQASWKLAKRVQALLAYTFQRSLRVDGPGRAEAPFAFDQPHILTALGTWEIGRGWRTSFRFRLVSGNPLTPVVGAVYDARSDTYVPIYGPLNSGRQALFHQLDLRVDKSWTFKLWKLSAYLDVQNVYNQGNQEGTSYSFDYARSQRLTGLPILPIVGVKGEW